MPMSPLSVAVGIFIVACLFTWIASLVTHEHSWVDRLWSILPAIYVWVFTIASGFHSVLLNGMAVLVTLWGARLTFNFARKGGYSGVEDYRWPVVRARMNRWQFEIFNILFIVIFQNMLLALIAMPALLVYQNAMDPITVGGVILLVLFALCLIGEVVADEQQWSFQQAKRAVLNAGGTPSANFIQTGLWSISRHPNYFCEIVMWWLVFLMGVVASGTFFQWTIAGPVLLTALFVGSTRLTEQISLSKYPEYADYQRSTSAVIPWFRRRAQVGSAA